MIQLVFARTEKRVAVNAAMRSVGLTCRFCAFSVADLAELIAPVMLVFDADGDPRLTPEALQTLRRAPTGGIRFAPALVFCADAKIAETWRQAGALPLLNRASVDEIIATAKRAMSSATHWIASPNYVGPDRRLRQTFGVKGRREDDAVAALSEDDRRGRL